MRWLLLLALVLPVPALALGPAVLDSPDLRQLVAGPMVYGGSEGVTCTFAAGVGWGTLSTPIPLAHRGSGEFVAPGNTMAAWGWAARAGFPIECDIQRTKDGVLICNHDATFSVPTGGAETRAASELTLAEVKALDIAQGFMPQYFSPQRPQTFAEYMALAQRKPCALLAPELRTGMGSEVGAAIKSAGLQQRFLLQSFIAFELAQAKAVDPSLRTMLLSNTGSTVSLATAQAGGHWAVCSDQADLLAAGASYVTQMHGAGIKVFAYTVDTIKEAETLRAIGVDGYFTDDAPHIARAGSRIPAGTTTVLRVPESFAPTGALSGWRFQTHTPKAYPAVVGGTATFANYAGYTTSSIFKLTVAGGRTADAPATQTIETSLKVVDITADTTRWMAVQFAWASERDGTSFPGDASAGGYYVSIRGSGAMELVRVNGTTFTILASGPSSALTQGQVVPFRIEMTATTVKATRSDTGHNLSAADGTLPRGGFVRMMSSGMIGGIGDVSITY